VTPAGPADLDDLWDVARLLAALRAPGPGGRPGLLPGGQRGLPFFVRTPAANLAQERFDVLATGGGIPVRASRWTPRHKGKPPARKATQAGTRELPRCLDHA